MNREPASFRDPAGFLFRRAGVLYRQVNGVYEDDYRRLMDSGLYDDLVHRGLLVEHEEVDRELAEPQDGAMVIKPREIDFISYPHEWCFDALKDAALLTLTAQKRALEYDMILKDASAYNIAFEGTHPIFIDTLSFETYTEGEPWVAYRQFCEHFLAPLATMSLGCAELGRLLRSGVDGVPLEVASSALPSRSWLSPGIAIHVHLHARGGRRWSAPGDGGQSGGVSRSGLMGLVDSLESAVTKLTGRIEGNWSDYYDGDSYTESGFEHKKEVVADYLRRLDPGTLWDLGGNVGVFSRMAEEAGARVVSMDADPACVSLNYRENRRVESGVLPLWVDLANPSPALGWLNVERPALLDRGPADVAMGLALVHHLAIGNNVPLGGVADLFARCGRDAIVEFVPREDHQVQGMLAGRRDVFDRYEVEEFEAAFSRHFSLEERTRIRDSERLLYLMRRVDGVG